jgi:periplasmic divalent cation tolerance protein
MVLIVLSTAPAKDGAHIARTLVEDKLVACVNILPNVTSIYRWKDDIQEDEEVLCVMKTTDDKYAALAERIAEIHPYDIPEIIAFPIERGSNSYLDWVKGQLG